MICFRVDDATRMVVYRRLRELGYNWNDGNEMEPPIGSTCLCITSDKLFHGTRAESKYDSLDDLFFSDKYIARKSLCLKVGGYKIIVNEAIKIGCQVLSVDDVRSLLTAYAQYNGGYNALLPD